MASIRTYITRTVFADEAGDGGMIPGERIVAACRTAGFDAGAVETELAALVREGRLEEENGRYGRTDAAEADGGSVVVGPTDAETLDVWTYHGDASMPWQFSVRRTADELVITQARGPVDEFDAVVKRFAIEARSVADGAAEFRESAVRRVWSEDPDRPTLRSTRSEAHRVEFLYRDGSGWHLARPTPESAGSGPVDTAGREPTGHPGIGVSSTFLRCEEATELKSAEERTYRVSADVLDAYDRVYVLSYHEVDEESRGTDQWEVEDATAHELVRE